MRRQTRAHDGARAGRRLSEIREQRGLSQPLLAAMIGVTKGTIQNYEHGRAALTADRLEQIAHALNVEPTDLLAPPGSPLPKYRFMGTRADRQHQDALDHLAAIWDQMREELRDEKGIDIGDQPARDWIEAIRERMGHGRASRAAYARIRKRLEAYHQLKTATEGNDNAKRTKFDQSC